MKLIDKKDNESLASQYAEESQKRGAMIYGGEEPWSTANDLPRSIIVEEITEEPMELECDEQEPRESTLAYRINGMMENHERHVQNGQ